MNNSEIIHYNPLTHAYEELVSFHESMLELHSDDPVRAEVAAELHSHILEYGFDSEAQVQAVEDAASNTFTREEEPRA